MLIFPDPVSSCPPWCDPRVHVDHTPDVCEHRSTPTSWEAELDDVVLHVSLNQLVEAGQPGPVTVHLSLEDLELARTVEVDLSDADARLLLAGLDVAAFTAAELARRCGEVR